MYSLKDFQWIKSLCLLSPPPLKSDTGSAYYMDNEFGLHALFMYVSIKIISSKHYSLNTPHTSGLFDTAYCCCDI